MVTLDSIKKSVPDSIISALSDGDNDLQQLIESGISFVNACIPNKADAYKDEAVKNYVIANLWHGIGKTDQAEYYTSLYQKMTGLGKQEDMAKPGGAATYSSSRYFTEEEFKKW